MEEGGYDNDIVADILHRDVEHFGVETAIHLGEVLAGDFQSLVPIFDENDTTASVAAEVLAESGCQLIVVGSVHLNVFIERSTNQFIPFNRGSS